MLTTIQDNSQNEVIVKTKICPNPNCTLGGIAQSVSAFKRYNSQGRLIYGRECNTCKRIEMESLKIDIKSLTQPPKRLIKKPVWLVIYKSYWP